MDTSAVPLVPLVQFLGAWLVLPMQFVSRDSVHLASPQIQGHPVHLCAEPAILLSYIRIRCPAGEGCDGAAPSSQYEVRVLQLLLHCIQEKQWVTANLGHAILESGPSQAPVRDVDADMLFRMHMSPRLVCSDRL